jgi:phosphate transport system permease protein
VSLSSGGASPGAPRPRRSVAAAAERRARGPLTALRAHGEPLLWLTSGGLAVALAMISGLLTLVFLQGVDTFWPAPVLRIETIDGRIAMGEVARTENWRPEPSALDSLPESERQQARTLVEAGDGVAERRLLRTGNFELTGEHFRWISSFSVRSETQPPWALVIERRAWGRFYGEPVSFLVDGREVAGTPPAVVEALDDALGPVSRRSRERRKLEVNEIGAVNRRVEAARLAVRDADHRFGRRSAEHDAAAAAAAALETSTAAEFSAIRDRIRALDAENDRYRILLRTGDGKEKALALADIVRAYPANSLSLAEKVGVYASRWAEFVSDEPREANSEGGVFPAIFGTVAMTLLMSLVVTPFGVMAALYLREYARDGFVISAVRIAINNLAGVPSIVFGVFGLGFFCYILGAGVDEVFFSAKLPTPTFGTGGILWASLTLALLTLPVVIVATEEALAAVPNSMREGSYACGASKWQTIRRIVLPRAMPGILTGMILAVARGAGEVAPLMLVGAVKLAPELPIDSVAPFVHLQRSFMHLGFHVYDVGFQSQNSEAARPMVFTTTLLLIAIIALLNLAAIRLRSHLRRRFVSTQF